MIYPKSIYNTYEIEEKEICGEMHYALVRIYNIFGFKFKRYVKVYQYDCTSGWIANYSGGKTWNDSKATVEDAISRDNDQKEWEFKEKMTK